jgi:hypothetical protein
MIQYPGSENDMPAQREAGRLGVGHLTALLPRYIQSRMQTVIADVAASVDENPETFSNVHNESVRALAQALVWTPTPNGTSRHLHTVEALLGYLQHRPSSTSDRFECQLHSEAHRRLNRSAVDPAQGFRGFRQRSSEVVVAR